MVSLTGFPDSEADALVVDTSGESSQSMLDSLSGAGLAPKMPIVLLAGNRWTAELPTPNLQPASREAFRSGVREILPGRASPPVNCSPRSKRSPQGCWCCIPRESTRSHPLRRLPPNR